MNCPDARRDQPEAATGLLIGSLGNEGDGVAQAWKTPSHAQARNAANHAQSRDAPIHALVRDAPIHVREALPGETVVPVRDGRFLRAAQILVASLDRVQPPCPLFGSCGGCVVQHLHPAAALGWKTAMVTNALRAAGFEPPARIATFQADPRTRRRMDLAIRRSPGGVAVGLHGRGVETVVPMTNCHVLHPVLFALVQALPATLARLQGLHGTGAISVNLLDSGPDILLTTTAPLTTRDRALLAEFARTHGVPRISGRTGAARAGDQAAIELVCQHGPVSHRFGGVAASPPPGAFLQATGAGEAAIVDAVLAALPARPPRGARAIELHAGCGTIGLPMSDRVRVSAFEGDAAAAACLRAAGGGRRIDVAHRDLNRRPVSAAELAGAAAIILDPPHGGAGPQARELPGSGVPLIVYVSCNPSSLGRDVGPLAAAGYRLQAVTVIDQFLWSARAESVCVFARGSTVTRGPMQRPPRR